MSNHQPPQGWGQPPQQPQQPSQPGWGQQPGPGPSGWGTPGPRPPKKSRMPVILAVVGVFVVLIIAVAITQNDGGGSPDGKSSTQSSGKVADAPVQQDTKGADRPKDLKPEDDVKITSCEVDSALSWPSAKLTITNQSSDTSNYLVSVEFVDAQGVRIGEGFAATNNLAPDRSAKEVAQGTAEAKGKITCKVTKVTRYAS